MYLAITLARLNDFANSCKVYEKAISMEHDHMNHLNYAITLFNHGEIEKVRGVYDKGARTPLSACCAIILDANIARAAVGTNRRAYSTGSSVSCHGVQFCICPMAENVETRRNTRFFVFSRV